MLQIVLYYIILYTLTDIFGIGILASELTKITIIIICIVDRGLGEVLTRL